MLQFLFCNFTVVVKKVARIEKVSQKLPCFTLYHLKNPCPYEADILAYTSSQDVKASERHTPLA